jgi:hypothetical protein
MSTLVRSVALVAVALSVASSAAAQLPIPATVEAMAQASAPVDLTGTWVSIVNEDWRWRMVTPPLGDFPGIPLNPAGQEQAMTWDPETDGSCLAFGAAGVMRMPTRLRISWENEQTLKLETDNGVQTRLLQFDLAALPGARSLQGHSRATWRRMLPASNPFGILAPGGSPAGPGGGLDAVTSNLEAAWLRRNGVPYSENTAMTEHFDRFPGPDGSEWLVVTTIVEDPTYLFAPFITSTHFRLEPDAAGWNPTPCQAPG